MSSQELINKNKKRNSAIELLRIIAMLMIVFHHFAVHGGFEWETTNLTIPYLWYNLIAMGGKIGVNVFVLISGYYLIDNDSFNFNKVLKLWGQVAFYSVTFFVLFRIMGVHQKGIKGLVYSFLPITYEAWWFASTYFVLYLLHPFLNVFLKSMDKNKYIHGLLLSLLCFSIIPTLSRTLFQGSNLVWFIVLYAIAGFIKIYGVNPKLSKKYCSLVFVFSIGCTFLISIIASILAQKWDVFEKYVTLFFGQDKILIVVASVSLFIFFITLKMQYHKWINVLASATFGVYLIHDNVFVQPYLWLDVFKNADFQKSVLLIPYSILVVIIVYICCTIIDLARQKFFEKPFMALVNKHSVSWSKSFMKAVNKIIVFIFGD